LSWKKKFKPSMPMDALLSLKDGFAVTQEPEDLGQGRYRVEIKPQFGTPFTIISYEGTIGNMLEAQKATGYCTCTVLKGSRGGRIFVFESCPIKEVAS